MDEIEKFIKNFTKEEIKGITKDGRKYFLANEEQIKIRDKIKTEAFAIGIFFGEMKKYFQPSPALIDLIAKKSNRKVFISKKAEWLFLCGRDVLEDSIVKKNVEEGLVLVQNEKDENLGYGIFSKKGNNLIIKNIQDKGSYLRREN